MDEYIAAKTNFAPQDRVLATAFDLTVTINFLSDEKVSTFACTGKWSLNIACTVHYARGTEVCKGGQLTCSLTISLTWPTPHVSTARTW